MKLRSLTWGTKILLAIMIGGVTLSWSIQQDAASGVPVSIVVTVEAKHGKEVPTIYREDVRVFQNKERLQVIDWQPLAGDHAGLEIAILIDDSSSTELGLQLDDIRKFINGQPQTMQIAVGYIRNGSVDLVQNFTRDHAQAAKALRMPFGSGGAMASPYLAVTDLISRWPASPNQHEMLLISSGIDALQPGPSNSYLDEAIHRAQRAGVKVQAIYAAPSGHAGHSFWLANWGQSNLSRLADETGGEFYAQGLGMPLSYAPYLAQIGERPKNQYKLTFLAKAANEGGYEHIRLETEVPNAELIGPSSVFIPATK